MNEVEKMYENTIGKQSYCTANDCLDMSKCKNCYFCKQFYPPFTAEKQLELIKWLATRELKIKTQKQPCATYIGILGQHECFYGIEETHFEQALAGVINYLWQNLTEEERNEIYGILRT